MSQPAAHSWLPIAAATRPQVRGLIEDAVAAWSATWFTSRALGVTGAKPLSGPMKLRADRPVFGSATAIGYSARAIARLLDWALDISLDEVTVTPADLQVINGVERQMIDDLAARIETALGVRNGAGLAAAGANGGLEICVGDASSGDLLTLSLPFEAMLGAIQASLPASPARPPLGSLGEALSPTSLQVEVTLGRADIRLDDLRGLAVGDVLVLDTPLDGAADVSLAEGEFFARGVLTDCDGHRAVTLQA